MDFWNGNGYGNGNNYGAGGNFDPDMRASFEEQLNAYNGKSQDELTAELMKRAASLRANGQLDPAALEAFYAQAAGFLTREQLAKMRALIDMLK